MTALEADAVGNGYIYVDIVIFLKISKNFYKMVNFYKLSCDVLIQALSKMLLHLAFSLLHANEGKCYQWPCRFTPSLRW